MASASLIIDVFEIKGQIKGNIHGKKSKLNLNRPITPINLVIKPRIDISIRGYPWKFICNHCREIKID